MRWYHHLYMGEQARKNRYRIVGKIRWNKFQMNVYVITLAANQRDLLDIYPSYVLQQKHFRKQDYLIVGIAKGYEEAVEVATKILMEVYTKTGSFGIREYIGG